MIGCETSVHLQNACAMSMDAIRSFLLLEARMLLVVMPGAPSSVLAPSSNARSP